MKNNFEEKNFEGLDSNPRLLYCGKRIGNIGHGFGPYLRDDYLICYIKEGEAELTVNGRRLLLKSEGFFVNFPKSGGVYRAREVLPWSIKWISAEGELIGRYLEMLGITPNNPYIPLENGYEIEVLFDEMYKHFDRASVSSRIYCVSLLHKLFSLLSAGTEGGADKSRYVQKALSIIEERYADAELNVFAIAAELNLHPNYFSILFKRETNMLPKHALLETRMRSAAKMLRFTDQPIKEIARSVGFSDELYFSRVFRRRYGASPSGYRRSLAYPT